jgi:hypothetical protein
MHTLYKGAPVTTPRALVLRHTVHRIGARPVPVAVVMFDVTRATDRHYRQVGARALGTLAALGVDVGSTDPLAFGRRFAYPVTDYSVHAVHLIDHDSGTGPADYSDTHQYGGGSLPGTADFLSNDGSAVILPPIDYTRSAN